MVSSFHNNGDRMHVLKNERLEKEVLLTISKSDLERDILTELLSESHQVKKHGFRSGKIPPALLFQERGQHAIDAVVHKAVLGAADEVIGERVLGAPLGYQVENPFTGSSLSDLTDLTVKVHAVFAPEISEIVWKDVHLERCIPAPTDKEVDLDVSGRAGKVMTSVALSEKRPAAIGDTLLYTMTYTHKDGTVKEVEGSFQLGSNTLPEEFEKSLEGIAEGHVVREGLKVPKDFPDKSLAGKKVDFSITFREIRQTVPHQANEEFAKSQGFETLDALRDAVRKSLVESGEVLSGMILRQDLKKKLGSLQSFDVPESWLRSAVESLKRANDRKLSLSGDSSGPVKGAEKMDSDGEKALQDSALARVRANCVVQKIVQDQRFSVTDSELFAYAKAMAQNEGRSIDDVVGFLRRNKGVVDRISSEIQERKALDWMSAQCAIEDKEVSFDGIKDLFAAEDSI